jgi:methylmalonyl-CoA mutase
MAWERPLTSVSGRFFMSDALFTNPFPLADEARWRAAVDKALKGADFEKKLVSRTADGLAIQPLYHRRADAELVAGATAGARWRIAARVDDPDPRAAAAQALDDLAGGADALALVFQGSASARGFGLPTTDAAAVDACLDGVALDLISVRIEPAPQARITARLFAEVVKRRRLAPADMAVDFGFDPLGLLARSGVLLAPWADIGQRLNDMVGEFTALGFRGPFITCDARIVHEAGGSEAQELAHALASAVAYLRALDAAGMPLADAARSLSFTIATDADQFMGVAKLRALRRLMARVQEACGLDSAPIRIHAETAWRMLTRRDVAVNMLRNAVASFTAAVGGADTITVQPHTAALGLPGPFARRIARNMQHVLAEEAHLWRVADPAAGAGGYEALTDALCAEAWDAFQQIEREGGLVASLTAGAFQARIGAVSARRARDIATGKLPLTGTSAFPDLAERPETVLAATPVPQRQVTAGPVTITPLSTLRLAEPFEALRDRAEALAAGGRAPSVFLATLGRVGDFSARAGFARGFFAAGGVAAAGHDGFADGDGATDLVALTDAFKASGAALACICGADEAYASEARDAALALGASGARAIWLAGRPGEAEAALRAAGVSGFVFMGADMIAALGEALAALEKT